MVLELRYRVGKSHTRTYYAFLRLVQYYETAAETTPIESHIKPLQLKQKLREPADFSLNHRTGLAYPDRKYCWVKQ